MVREYTFYTATRTPDLDREFTKPIIWASVKPHESNLYGDYLWRISVRLPANKRGNYLLSGEQPSSDWGWGSDGSGYVCFRSTCVEDIELIEC